ncbi:MAG: APC family permease [Chloroflexi bacterium]|nr:APC family permease [Chloroflexota bacterium]MDA8189435.1 APC family permease [Dehalococcoidales bacterium]
MGDVQGRDFRAGPRAILTAFDVTSLVVGAVVGADIYVVASLGAGLMGPAMLVAWVIAGIMAGFIALSFAQCVAIVPKAGGPYAYVRETFGYFPGFLVGWSLYLAELVAISVFPVAFVRYLTFFFQDLIWWQDALAKGIFIAFLTATNYLGARIAGKVNDVLMVAKMGPLLLLILLGVAVVIFSPASSFANLVPFVPLGWGGIGSTIILAFWAYAGFELAVLPAAEIIDAPRILPVSIIQGMAIVTVFYLSVNAIVVLVMPWYAFTASTAPLALAMETIIQALSLPLWTIGAAIMAVGAILSISGADESATLGTSRLSYAMAADGYFPHVFAKIDPRYGTPYLSLLFQGVFTLVASLLGSLTGLIELSVFFLSVTYLGTVLAAMRLVSRAPDLRLRFVGSRAVLILALVSSLYLVSQTEKSSFILGIIAIALGVPIYAFFAPKNELSEVRDRILSEEQRLAAIQRALLVAPARALEYIHALFSKG